uniref:Uncharacterized protein n=1 Tax=Anguilla anguilla TaxID=7936 RepID=A0A0E9U0Y9_ANGAN
MGGSERLAPGKLTNAVSTTIRC